MSLPAEKLHKQSLDILAKLATFDEKEDSQIRIVKMSVSSEKCSMCSQVSCDRNCDKENQSKSNSSSLSEKGLLTPQKCNPSPEPVTPTANLKMLVSAASDLQPASMQNQNCVNQELEVYTEDSEDPTGNKAKLKKELMGRKEKSLGLLCKKFMSIYPEYSPVGTTIMLDDVVKSLSIGRRRVYDIVNVLESMEMMVRQAKNKYIWFGKSRLPATLSKLKALALRVYGSKFCNILRRYCHIQPKAKGEKNCFILPKPLPPQEDGVPSSIKFEEEINEEPCNQMEVDDLTRTIMDTIILYDHVKKDSNRSLGILCQKFIMLFMVAEDNTVTLDRAAKLLITEPEEGPGKYKTKVRRLYDIANILTSINFLEKCVSYEDATKKAAYKWIGLDLNSINCEEGASKAFLSQEFSLTRHSLLTQAPIAYSKSVYGPDKLKQRKFRFRSSSAHQLNVTNPSNVGGLAEDMDNAKKIRSFALRTLSADTMVNNEGHVQIKKCDGFDIEEVVEITANTSTCQKNNSVEDSPKQALFKQKLRDLQKEFPDKLPGNGLLDLLNVCKSNSAKEKLPTPSRRRLSSDFDGQGNETQAKKPKLDAEEESCTIKIVTVPADDVNEKDDNDTTNTTNEMQTTITQLPSQGNIEIINSNTNGSNQTKVKLNDCKMLIASENVAEKSSNNGVWQQATYFTIPATLQPVVKPGSSAQSITTMLVSPISNPISIPKSGLYQIIPVQCHSVVERNESLISSTNQQPTLVARPVNSNCEGIKINDKVNIPILMRPSVTVSSSPVTISPKPSSLKSFTDSPINHPQLNGNFSEFVTPPHITQNHFGKPPANPIIFPKMTPETPSSTGPISQSVLTNVTRKLMSLQQDDNS